MEHILQGRNVRVVLADDLRLLVFERDGDLLWESSRQQQPLIRVGEGGVRPSECELAAAKDVSSRPFTEGGFSGQRLLLSGYPGSDVAIELIVALDPDNDDLLIQVEQVSGQAAVVRVDHLYRFEKPVAQGGYMVLPCGSGYLVPADCPDELPGRGSEATQIGGQWALPMLGMTRNGASLCAIVDTWWDAEVRAHHRPGDRSLLDFSWADSLGRLGYPRRLTVRFGQDMDYVAMAKIYRGHAGEQGLVRTLAEKATELPAINEYVGNVLFRWVEWNGADSPRVLDDIRRIRDLGLGVNFFYPKWGSKPYSPAPGWQPEQAGHNWQSYLNREPVEGGWPRLAEVAERAHRLGAVNQAFVRLCEQFDGDPGYDPARLPLDQDGKPLGRLGTHDALDLTRRVLDSIGENDLRFDLLYFDGYTAAETPPQDFSPAHPATRQQVFEAQNACFAETRRRGIMAGGELRQFWAMANCDWCFFTDWSGHRLANVPNDTLGQAPVGEPIPLCQLVFHDCCICGFSGDPGQGPQFDWFSSRPHRLYELLYAGAPSYNWIRSPQQVQPVPVPDWDSQPTKRAFEWLRKWSAYYRSIAMAEMTSHQFVTADRTRQRVEFANGVATDVDLAGNRYRISGMENFDDAWQHPESF